MHSHLDSLNSHHSQNLLPGERPGGGALALHYAAARGCLDCVRLLVEATPEIRLEYYLYLVVSKRTKEGKLPGMCKRIKDKL